MRKSIVTTMDFIWFRGYKTFYMLCSMQLSLKFEQIINTKIAKIGEIFYDDKTKNLQVILLINEPLHGKSYILHMGKQ